jgi:hypothetical protein
MNYVAVDSPLLQREALVHALYEAAELEHNLTYLYWRGGSANKPSAMARTRRSASSRYRFSRMRRAAT